jgi:hypothetical protein
VTRYGRVAFLALLALGPVACSSGATSTSSVKAACAALREFDSSRQLADDAAMRRDIRRAEQLAGTSGNEQLADSTSNAADLLHELSSRPRSDALAPQHQALTARLAGNLSFAHAECADAGYPTSVVTGGQSSE